MIEQIIDYTGFYGPEILLVMSIILLRNKHSFLTIYGGGFAVNIMLNYILKGLFKHPRPSHEVHLFKLEELYRKKVGFEKYGMPSGHLQSTLYSTVFIALATRNVKVTLFFALISLITMWQRIKYNHHNLLQVLIGALVGGLVGFLFYIYAKTHLRGKMKKKMDDDAPV